MCTLLRLGRVFLRISRCITSYAGGSIVGPAPVVETTAWTMAPG